MRFVTTVNSSSSTDRQKILDMVMFSFGEPHLIDYRPTPPFSSELAFIPLNSIISTNCHNFPGDSQRDGTIVIPRKSCFDHSRVIKVSTVDPFFKICNSWVMINIV